MNQLLGTVTMGLRAPIINEGDDLAAICCDTLSRLQTEAGIRIEERDILGITESVLARAQGNYVDCDTIAADVRARLGGDEFGLLFPITSRNRFAICLRGIARGAKHLWIQLSYPSDEVGNELFDHRLLPAGFSMDETYLEAEFRAKFPEICHPITRLDYPAYYREICEEEGCSVDFIFSNDPLACLAYTDRVLTCDIHERQRTKALLEAAKPEAKIVALYELMSESRSGSGYNAEYGLLGSNKATETSVKLFPRDAQSVVEAIQAKVREHFGVEIEVMIYGDGAFKDPACKIWELADPVVSPGFTAGLQGTPHELKLKYLADNAFKGLSSEEQAAKIREAIRAKSVEETTGMAGEGTTPRQITDLLGSLCDLTSGSGDKGTPLVYIKGYFRNYAEEI
ncbi:MAG: coenzyme F420-0:L-glutamate ligase [Eubacteriales bacterium]|nr:coenzyme F420-0:L-glutamate ligase [Eubacteriales bacterium]